MTVARTCNPCGDLLPVRWGFSALTTLTEANVLALDYSEDRADLLGTFTFTGAAGDRYLWVAIPTDFGEIESFTTEGYLDLVPITSSVDVTVDAVEVPYTLYRSSELQNATGIVLESD